MTGMISEVIEQQTPKANEYSRTLFCSNAARFKTESARLAIEAQIEETLAWLRKRDKSYDHNGNIKDKPWYETPPETGNNTLLTRRLKTLLDRVYEHGVFSFMLGLHNKKLIHLDAKAKEKISNAMTFVVINELVGFALANDRRTHSLSDLRKLYGTSKNTKLAHIRETHLKPLDELGLIEMNERQDGYQIKIGPIGLAFFEKVHAPIFGEMWSEKPMTKKTTSNGLAAIAAVGLFVASLFGATAASPEGARSSTVITVAGPGQGTILRNSTA